MKWKNISKLSNWFKLNRHLWEFFGITKVGLIYEPEQDKFVTLVVK